MADWENYLESIYFNPNHPGGFVGVDKLYRVVRKEGRFNISKDNIKKWLKLDDSYTLHRPAQIHFKRPRVVVASINYQWEADTANMFPYAKDNDDYKYFLLVIDAFSKYMWTEPLKTKFAKEMVTAFRAILNRAKEKYKDWNPKNEIKCHTDKGGEFLGDNMQKFFKDNNLHHFITESDTKASIAERGIKTLKMKIAQYMTHRQTHRWVDILQQVTHSYNNSYHRSIKMIPSEVKTSDEPQIWKNLYDDPRPKHIPNPNRKPKKMKSSFKFDIGQHVRVSYLKHAFTSL